MTILYRTALLVMLSSYALAGENSYYTQDQLQNKKIESIDGGYRVTFTPMLETLYYSPGIDIVAEGNTHRIKVVRCKIKQTCEVDYKAVYTPERSLEVTLQFPANF
jgi:hypothetical protein